MPAADTPRAGDAAAGKRRKRGAEEAAAAAAAAAAASAAAQAAAQAAAEDDEGIDLDLDEEYDLDDEALLAGGGSTYGGR